MPLDTHDHETIALVSCVKKKRRGPCAAGDLYVSPLFCFMRSYAERHADRWFILSAKYGLLEPDARVTHYEQTLNDMPSRARRAWAERVLADMRAAGLLHAGAAFVWLAGQAYQRHLSVLLAGFPQTDPLAGMRFGERLAWLKKHNVQAR
ncbi:MAG: DUF6884 domain-containing protein [Phycisphaerae bacterium]